MYYLPNKQYLRKQNKSVKGLDCVNFDNVNLFINAYKLSFNHQMSNRIQQVQPDFLILLLLFFFVHMVHLEKEFPFEMTIVCC